MVHLNWMANHNIRSQKKTLNTCFERTVYQKAIPAIIGPNSEAPHPTLRHPINTPNPRLQMAENRKLTDVHVSTTGCISTQRMDCSCKINRETWMNCYDATICTTKEVTLARLLDSCQGLSVKQSNRSKLSAETRRITLPCLLVSCIGL